MQLNATEQDVSNQTKNTRDSKMYITSSRVVALFRWQENTATAAAISKLAELPSKTLGKGARGGGGGGGGD